MWRRSPVTTPATVYRHPIHRQPLRQPLLATFFQAISLYPEHLRNSCSGRSGRASQPVPATLAPVRSPETSEPEPGGGSAPRAQTPRPPAIWPSCVRVRRPGPAPAPSQPHPAASRSRLRSPHPWPIHPRGPAPAPSPQARPPCALCVWPMGCPGLCVVRAALCCVVLLMAARSPLAGRPLARSPSLCRSPAPDRQAARYREPARPTPRSVPDGGADAWTLQREHTHAISKIGRGGTPDAGGKVPSHDRPGRGREPGREPGPGQSRGVRSG